MTGQAGRPRVRRAAMEWDVPTAEPSAQDVDERLRAGIGRTGLLQVLIDHDTPGSRRCPRCGWATTTSRRDCPSRLIANALLDRKPLPGWLAHLAGEIPGARTRRAAVSDDKRHGAADGLPGLFDPPPRTRPGGDHG